MKEEGRKVAEMGGLHIVGTERHEARRIDNQLRGRAGRQGDPGSSRFFLSLQDDLMRIFAGEWVASVLDRAGHGGRRGDREPAWSSRRIEAAQKKVEERNFDIRKNLLEYDEVMDHQRKRGLRLPPGDPRRRQLQAAHPGHDRRADRRGRASASSTRLRRRPASPSSRPTGWASSSTPPTSAAATSTEAEQDRPATRPCAASRRRSRRRWTRTSAAEDAKEWNWQAMADQVNTRWGLKTTDRELKKIGRDNLAELPASSRPTKAIEAVDLTEGQAFLAAGLGRAVAVRLGAAEVPASSSTPQELAGKDEAEVKESLHDAVREAVPPEGDRVPGAGGDGAVSWRDQPAAAAGGQRYDREGLYRWAAHALPGTAASDCARRTSAPSREPGCTRCCWRSAGAIYPDGRRKRRSTTSWTRPSRAANVRPRPRTPASWPSGSEDDAEAWTCPRRR